MVASRRKLRIVFYGTGPGGADDRPSPPGEALRDGLVGEGHEVVGAVPLAALRSRSGARADRADRAGGARRPDWASVRADRARPDVVVVGGGGEPGRFDVHLARLRWWRSLVVVLRPGVGGGGNGGDGGADLGGGSGPGLTSGAAASRRQRGPLRGRLDRAGVRRADLVVETRLPGPAEPAEPGPLTGLKTVVVPVGVGTAWFEAAARRRALPAAAYQHGPLRVVHFPTGSTALHTAIVGEAIRLLADDYVEWTMLGGDDERRRVEAITGGRGKVTWIEPGAVGGDLPNLVAHHDVALGRFDGEAGFPFPWDVVQAIAAGCAVVTAADPTLAQLVGDAGMYVPPTHPEAVASVLTALAVDPDHLAARRDAARRAAEALTPARVVAPLAARLADSPDIPF